MSDEKLHFTAIGMLRPSDIGGDICENCPNNEHILSSALLTGGEMALRNCASLIFSDCEIVQSGTKERIKKLESENNRLREALEEIAKFANNECEKRGPAPSCVEFMTIRMYAEKALKGEGK